MKGDYYLTVGHLKRILKTLHDDVPVYYERIEDAYFDNNWTPDLLVADDYSPDIRELDSEYLRAFTAFKEKHDGKVVAVCITAHY